MTKDKETSYQPTEKMRDLIDQDYSLLRVMSRFGISLGFGDKTVQEICNAQGVDVQTFLTVANFNSKRSFDFNQLSLTSLIQYLKSAHNYFLDFNLPTIRRRLVEAVSGAGSDEIALLILRFFDEYVAEVHQHMEYENTTVFTYVEQLLKGYVNRQYTISTFAGKHIHIGYKLNELKDVIVRFYPEKNSHLLNAVLFDIITCEADLSMHCRVEDRLFIPAVEQLETTMRHNGKVLYAPETTSVTTDKEQQETLSKREKDIIACLAQGMSHKEIADKLCVSVHTVATHRRNLSNKLQIHSSAGLTIYAIVNRLIDVSL